MPNRSGKSAAAFIGKAACCFLQLIRFLLGFMQINYARMQQTGQPFLSCPVLFWDLCSSPFCITSSSRCDADDGVNPMETVRLMLYRFLFIILVLLIFIIGNYSINIKIVVRTEGRVDCRPQAINIRTLGRPFFIDGRICIRPCLVAFR